MLQWQNHTIDLRSEGSAGPFDVVVVGAGLGGSIVGLGLAERGLKVLFLEAGSPVQPGPRRTLVQKIIGALGFGSRAGILAAQGRWSRLEGLKRGARVVRFYPILGTGPGGSSAIYGAALERMKREDFAAKPLDDEGALPNAWPIDYDTFDPLYAAAERMMDVCGTPDPLDPDDRTSLREPPPLSEQDDYFAKRFEAAGLHPYRLHVSIEYRPGCAECVGRICPRGCKADGTSRGLFPALSRYGAKIAFGTSVETVITEGERATGVRVRVGDRTVDLHAGTVVLAAGALNTPVILLNSRSKHWPNGIGNGHDLVGRGLMFHISDFFALKSNHDLDQIGAHKTLSFRDFYSWRGSKLGSVQSVGIAVSARQIASFASDWLIRNLGFGIPGGPLVLRMVGAVGLKMFRGAALFATIVEDFPHRYNRVVPDANYPGQFIIDYRKSNDLNERAGRLRSLLKELLPHDKIFFLSGNDNLNYGHACGTCRFGEDPRTSVLSPDNRVWGMDNLYVVDASFFPSSSGANPSLTIVANALRIGSIIAKQAKSYASVEFETSQV